MADTDTFEHSGVRNEGENLFEASPNATLASAALEWCNEIKYYSGQILSGANFESYGHYTQVVWPTTTAVGMGAARSASGKVYVCGRYSPPGNGDGKPAWGPGGSAGQGGGNPQQHADGVYLVNSFNGNQSSSGFAYYSKLVHASPVSNLMRAFKDGNVFKASVNANAATVSAGVKVGEAANNFHSFNIVFRADGSEIYTINGWKVFAIYQCL